MSDTSAPAQPRQDWMEAAHLLRPQGRRGEILAEPSADLDLFTPGRQFAFGRDRSAPASVSDPFELETAWQPTGKNAGRLVLKLRGTDTISAAEALAGQYLFLRADELPPLEEGTYRVRDLVGCALLDRDRLVGEVTDLQFPVAPDGRTRLVDAPDLLVVQPAAEIDASPERGSPEAVLVPFVRAWLLEVDLPARRLRMELPPGLFLTAE